MHKFLAGVLVLAACAVTPNPHGLLPPAPCRADHQWFLARGRPDGAWAVLAGARWDEWLAGSVQAPRDTSWRFQVDYRPGLGLYIDYWHDAEKAELPVYMRRVQQPRCVFLTAGQPGQPAYAFGRKEDLYRQLYRLSSAWERPYRQLGNGQR